ncbi:MAG: Membrane protein insertase YidC [Syntrophorhabdaceae bacterium PtaU1.Bin034]|nr:MAG: Membrane protein insertase YidC [Syntrophorhabdaceae bacterium PtaU1.Bin034]
MEKRTLIAVLLSVIILFVWQFFLSPKTPPSTEPQTTAQTQKQGDQSATEPAKTGQGAKQGQETERAALPLTEKRSTKQINVETPKLRIKLGDLGGGLTSVRLKEYKEAVGGSQEKELLENIAPYRYIPAVSQTSGNGTVSDATLFKADKENIVVRDKPETLTFSGELTNGKKIKKVYTFYPDTYTIGLNVQVEGLEQSTAYADFALFNMKDKSSYVFKGPFIYDGKKFQQVDDLGKQVNANKSYSYAGFDEGYFSFIFLPQGTTKPDLLVTKVVTQLDNSSVDVPVDRLIFDKNGIDSTLYFVPNKLSLLKELNIHAEKIVDFGWFDIVAKPMLWGMNWANRFTRNYGIDIILLTILIKIIFYPLSVKSYKSMKEMQKLQPMIAKLKEKYKDDKEKLNREMMGIYKTKGINPLGGCLPMVIQIPVFFALYKVLMGAIEFRHAPFMLWINDLAAPEDLFTFHVAGFALPLRILPLIMGITMVIQQKMTPTGGDPMQAKMMMFMPIFFTFLFWGFPSGLVLYWLVNNVISIGQQYYINKRVA